jgi:two-component system NtrC family sensor kinase
MQTHVKTTITVFLLFFPYLLFAQQKPGPADLLLAKLSVAAEDTNKVHLYDKLESYYEGQRQYDSMMAYVQKGLTLAEKLQWPGGELMMNMDMGFYYWDKSHPDYNSALTYFNKAISFAKQIHDRANENSISYYTGFMYDGLNDHKKALDIYLTTLNHFKETDTTTTHIFLLYRIYYAYRNYFNEYKKAADFVFRAKALADAGHNSGTQNTINRIMGGVYRDSHDYKRAIYYFVNALRSYEESGDRTNVYGTLSNIGATYSTMHDYNNYLLYAKKRLSMAEELKNDAYKSASLNEVAWAYFNLKDYEHAYPFSKESLEIKGQSSADSADKLNTLGCIIRDASDLVLKKYGLNPAEKYESAVRYFLLSNKYSASAITQEQNFLDLSLAYEQMNDYKKAYTNYKRYTFLSDSLADDHSGEKEEALVSQELQNKFGKEKDSLKYQQALTNEKLKQKELITTQQRQTLLLNQQQLSLANKQKDIERLNYLKTQAGLVAEQNKRQANEQQLKATQKEQALAVTSLQLQKAELSSKKQQSYYFMAGLAALLLLSVFIGLNYYNQRRSNLKLSDANIQITEANNQITKANYELNEKQEEIRSQRDQLSETLEELKTSQTQLVQREKMASLGELTAGIAHEIQNPLNFVNNFSEVNTELIEEMELEIEHADLAEVKAIAANIKANQQKISQHGKRADFIVKGMLQHSRTSTGERQLTNINMLADEFLKLSYHGLRAKDKNFNAEMITHFDEALPKIEMVQQDVGRVLLNLFNNAFYAVYQKKKSAGAEYKPEVTVTTISENGHVIIKVKDNGTGIPDAIKDKIMQPFFTTKPSGEGTGLGLSLSYDIVVKGHGGSIAVDTEEGEGSEFTVQLSRV